MEIVHKNNKEFKNWANSIINHIKQAQTETCIKVNTDMLELYWFIGKSVIEVQKIHGWGSKIIDELSLEINTEFPHSTGFSVRNIKYMRAFADAYPDFPIVQVPLAQSKNEFVQVPLAQITWYHHISLLSKVKDLNEKAFYIHETAKNQWSRDVMLMQIKSGLYQREGKAINNFKNTLPQYQSDLAKGLFKDPYKFGFLTLAKKINEKEIEDQLTSKITDFLLELGKGFSFVGRQYPIVVDDTDYKIDILFYHIQLRCYVVIELKAVEFKPEFISKLNFYISAVDEYLSNPNDQPTIGLLLCASKSNVKVEFAMRGLNKPLGVAEYQLEQIIKENLALQNRTVENDNRE